MKTDRPAAIREHLFKHGLTPVQVLADEIGTSLATLRRDLAALEKSGVIERVHGAARIADGASVEVAFSQRETVHLAAKRSIASAAFEIIEPKSILFLDAGTTVLQLARLIKLSQMPVTVFTNGLMVAQELMAVPNVQVTILGGSARYENMSVVGPLAEAMLEGLWFDRLFLGASAIDDSLLMTSYDAQEARLNSAMASRAAHVCVVADSSKFGRRATYSVLPLRAPHQLITNAQVSADKALMASVVAPTITIASGDDHV